VKSYVTPEYLRTIREAWEKVQREMAEQQRETFRRIVEKKR